MKMLLILLLLISIVGMVSASEFGYDNPTLPSIEVIDEYIIRTGDSISGTYDFNGGWINDGLTISGGDIYAQTGYFYNITSLNITHQNLTINDDLRISGNLFSDGVGDNYFLGDVGIGTTTPDSPLTVQSAANGVDVLKVLHDGGTDQLFKVRQSGNDAIVSLYKIGDVKTVQIGSDGDSYFNGGNVGIGTDNPEDKLQIVGGGIVLDQGSAYRSLDTGGTIRAMLYKSATDETIIATATGEDIVFKHGGTEFMTMDGSTTNVGIGTATPTHRLDVETAENVVASFVSTDDDGKISITDDDTTTYIQARNDVMSFGFSPVQASNILHLNNGNVGIGTASPADALEVAGTGQKIILTDSADSYSERVKVAFVAGLGGYIVLNNHTTGAEAVKLRAYGDSYFNGGNVGIGTDSPSQKLEVQSTDDTSAIRIKTIGTTGGVAALVIDAAGAFDSYIDFKRDAAQDFTLGVDDTDGYFKISDGAVGTNTRLTIDTSGNVGIGTASPEQRLSVSDGTYGILNLNTSYSGAWATSYATIQAKRLGTSDAWILALNPAGGNVGIGTASPSAKLDVHSSDLPTATLRRLSDVDATNTQLWFEHGATSSIAESIISSIYDDAAADGTHLAFATSKPDTGTVTEKMRIQGDGNVGIGTTSPTHKLNVIGGFNVTGIVHEDRTSKGYAQTDFHNETDPLVIGLSIEDLYYNVTGLHLLYNNSISMIDGQATIHKSSMYQLVGSVSFSGGNSGVYRYNLFVNNEEEHACGAMRTTTSTALGSISINCLVYLEEGDLVNMRIKDTTSPVQDVDIYTLTFNMVEV